MCCLAAVFRFCAKAEASVSLGRFPAVSARPSSIHLVESYLDLGMNRMQAAARAMERVLAREPDNYKVKLKLADLYYRLGRHGDAVRLLESLVHLSCKRLNVPYFIALNLDASGDLPAALEWYYKALDVDPGLKKAYVKIARIRMKQKLAFDAARTLRKVLDIDPDYEPAIEELKIVNRLIKMNNANFFRKGGFVILFPDYRLYPKVERIAAVLQRARARLEEKLRYHIPMVWIRIVNSIRKDRKAVVRYSKHEQVLYATRAVLKEKESLRLLVHELAVLYLKRASRNIAEQWFVEGVALQFSRPPVMAEASLRGLDNTHLDFTARLPSSRRYLDFRSPDKHSRTILLKLYCGVRFLIEKYGWSGIRRIVKEYATGTGKFARICRNLFLVDLAELKQEWYVYAMTHYYFNPPLKKADLLEGFQQESGERRAEANPRRDGSPGSSRLGDDAAAAEAGREI